MVFFFFLIYLRYIGIFFLVKKFLKKHFFSPLKIYILMICHHHIGIVIKTTSKFESIKLSTLNFFDLISIKAVDFYID